MSRAGCAICQSPLRTRGAKRFCSWACYQVEHAMRDKVCAGCGQGFRRAGGGRFCSMACRIHAKRGRPARCLQCAVEFSAIKFNRQRQRFASVNGVKTCSDLCLREFYRTDEQRKQKIGRAFTGDRHPNWQGGKSYQSNHGYRGPGWSRIAAAVRRRARGRCEGCGAVPRRELDVHHIEPFFNFTSAREANRPSNLIALCPSCHCRREHATGNRQMVMGFVAGPSVGRGRKRKEARAA